MKKLLLASSILFLLTACDTLGIPHMLADDQVPDNIKKQPMLVETPQPHMVDESGWPRLGDVPRAPKDFTTKPVYDHYMSEMEYHREEADAAKKQAVDEDFTLTGGALPDAPAGPPMGTGPHTPLLPPQLPGK